MAGIFVIRPKTTFTTADYGLREMEDSCQWGDEWDRGIWEKLQETNGQSSVVITV